MKDFIYAVETHKTVADAVSAIEDEAVKNGFKILHIHNFDDILASKGFKMEAYKSVEICNAKAAYGILTENADIGLLLPCKINVYIRDGKTYIAGLRPTIIGQFVDSAEVNRIADEVEKAIINIIDSAR